MMILWISHFIYYLHWIFWLHLMCLQPTKFGNAYRRKMCLFFILKQRTHKQSHWSHCHRVMVCKCHHLFLLYFCLLSSSLLYHWFINTCPHRIICFCLNFHGTFKFSKPPTAEFRCVHVQMYGRMWAVWESLQDLCAAHQKEGQRLGFLLLWAWTFGTGVFERWPRNKCVYCESFHAHLWHGSHSAQTHQYPCGPILLIPTHLSENLIPVKLPAAIGAEG